MYVYNGARYEVEGVFVGDGKHYDRVRSSDMPKRVGTLLLKFQEHEDESDQAAYEYEIARSDPQPTPRQADNMLTAPAPDPLRYFVQ